MDWLGKFLVKIGSFQCWPLQLSSNQCLYAPPGGGVLRLKTLFSTEIVEPHDRLELWHDVACRSLVTLEATPAGRETFRASLQFGTLADLSCVLFDNSLLAVTHTARQCLNPDEIHVCRRIDGWWLHEQDGREAVLEPGGIMLVDPRLPYRGMGHSWSLNIRVPRAELVGRLGDISRLLTRPIMPTAPAARYAADLLIRLPALLGRLDKENEEILRDQVLDAIAAAFADEPQDHRCAGCQFRIAGLAGTSWCRNPTLPAVLFDEYGKPVTGPWACSIVRGLDLVEDIRCKQGMAGMQFQQLPPR